MEFKEFQQILKDEKQGEVYFEEPLRNHTSWRIGGAAEILYLPHNMTTCLNAMQKAREYGIKVTYLGTGTNVLVSDRGIRGLVLKTSRLTAVGWDGARVTAGAGTSLIALSHDACSRGLSGLEFAAGIPGSLGGAVIMNAGAHGSMLAPVVLEVTTADLNGKVKVYSREDLKFAYRSSVLQGGNELVLEVKLRLQPGDSSLIKQQMRNNITLRKNKQPLDLPNAGSVFKNPPNDFAARLIEGAGAKGWRVGDAQVSRLHTNFIVNLGNATADDVIKLIEEVKSAVQDKYGINLEEEIIFLGFKDTGRCDNG